MTYVTRDTWSTTVAHSRILKGVMPKASLFLIIKTVNRAINRPAMTAKVMRNPVLIFSMVDFLSSVDDMAVQKPLTSQKRENGPSQIYHGGIVT